MTSSPDIAGRAPRRRKLLAAASAGAKQVLTGANGWSLGLAREPRKLLEYVGETGFLYRSYSDRRGIPQKTVFEVCGNGQAEAVTTGIRLAWIPPHANAWFRPVSSYAVDLMELCAMCSLTKPKVVFEIGTLTGYTALHFALNAGDDAEIYTLDLPRSGERSTALATTLMDDEHIRRHAGEESYAFDNYPEAGKIHTLFGDSATFDFSPFEGRVDLFFIDGAHSYEYVRRDTESALRCCHPGSVIAWHDYGRTGVNGVSLWVDEFARNHKVFAGPGSSVAFTVLD